MSRWPHRLAILMAVCTFPLIWVGGLVTSTDAGMAVPDWPTTYGYNLFLYPWKSWFFGPWDLFIEHGHRLLGAAVGLLTLALAVAVWVLESRRPVRLLALLAVALVVGQGLLGGMRVLWDERILAMIHAMVGPAYFALAVVIVFLTGSTGLGSASDRASAPGLLRLAIPAAALAYAQIVLGALIRHAPPTISPDRFRVLVYFHLAGALLLTGYVVPLCRRLMARRSGESSPRRSGLCLAAVMLAQLVLGGATWLARFGWPAGSESYWGPAAQAIEAGGFLQTYGVTAHVAMGSLVLALLIWIVLMFAFQTRAAGDAAADRPQAKGAASRIAMIRRVDNRFRVAAADSQREVRVLPPAVAAGGHRP